MKRCLILLVFVMLPMGTVRAGTPAESYEIQDVPMPRGVAPEIGGLAFTSKGELIVITRRYGILIGTPNDDPKQFKWRVFADTSLHNPMGILVENDHTFLVPTMEQLTRISDTDGDGVADLYECVSQGWGISGNYHETNTGPVPDGEGNWLLAIGTASYSGPTFEYLRGPYSKAGRRGRNYAAVQWKGCVVRIKPDGSVEPYAYGFRANNGICRDDAGHIWVTDNQGDWRGTSPLFDVKPGGFYGHPTSLVWDKSWTKSDDPLRYAAEHREEMDNFRQHAAVEFPQGLMASSPSQPIIDTTGGKFGPFAGQMFIGDVAGTRIVRVMLEEVDGVMQGACTHLVNGGGLRGGNNRLCLSPDGRTLYVGQTFRGWGGPAEGLQRIIYKGKPPFDVKTMSLDADGYTLTFTAPVNADQAGRPDTWRFQRYHYDYTFNYGSPQLDVQKLTVKAVKVADDGLSVRVTLGEPMIINRIYQVDVNQLHAADGRELANDTICYTVDRLRPGK
ncbi:MAG: hypothetical protein GC162_12110 [Planctomycetes bacterium]|nr:hypothetical protein [Planctomycetota bacterium]